MNHIVSFSIIIPVYNKASTLPHILDCCSTINKSICHEIIFVDDGSTDSSYEILSEYTKQNNNVILIKQNNSGVATARNVGFKKATGEYIIFIDADDIFEAHLLNDINECLSKKRFDILFLRFAFAKNRSNILPTYIPNSFNSDILLSFTPMPWGRVYRREFLTSNGIVFPNFRTAEDMVFNSLCALYNPKIYLCDKTFIYYYVNKNSLSNTINNNPYVIVDAINYLYDEAINRFGNSTFLSNCIQRYAIHQFIMELRKMKMRTQLKFISRYRIFFNRFKSCDLTATNLLLESDVLFHRILINHKKIIFIILFNFNNSKIFRFIKKIILKFITK